WAGRRRRDRSRRPNGAQRRQRAAPTGPDATRAACRLVHCLGSGNRGDLLGTCVFLLCGSSAMRGTSAQGDTARLRRGAEPRLGSSARQKVAHCSGNLRGVGLQREVSGIKKSHDRTWIVAFECLRTRREKEWIILAPYS